MVRYAVAATARCLARVKVVLSNNRWVLRKKIGCCASADRAARRAVRANHGYYYRAHRGRFVRHAKIVERSLRQAGLEIAQTSTRIVLSLALCPRARCWAFRASTMSCGLTAPLSTRISPTCRGSPAFWCSTAAFTSLALATPRLMRISPRFRSRLF
jgi:hypothetical protein